LCDKLINRVIKYEAGGQLYDSYHEAIEAVRTIDDEISELQSDMDLQHNRLSDIDYNIKRLINKLKEGNLIKYDRYDVKSSLYKLYRIRIDGIKKYKNIKRGYYEALRLKKEGKGLKDFHYFDKAEE